MAVLSSAQLMDLRDRLCRNTTNQRWTKAQVNAALQAVENRVVLPATKTAIAGDIETAAPGVFNASEKELLFGIWCYTAAARLGVI